MESDKIYNKILEVKALAERCVETHRGDGLAEPMLDLCEMLLDGHPGEAPDVDDDTDDVDTDDDTDPDE